MVGKGVVTLGGGANALSVARCLGRRGVKVFSIAHRHDRVRYSRYSEYIFLPDKENLKELLENYLLSDNARHLHGFVLLACADIALEILIKRREELSQHFILDIMNIEAQKCLLNKKSTYEAALKAEVPAPRFWEFKCIKDASALACVLCYPIMIKPEFTYKFEEKYGRKYLLAQNRAELEKHLEFFSEFESRGILLEYIPGPDSQLCSYYTYIDKDGTPLFDFTKRIIRRYPKHEGNGCYHITDNIDEVKKLSLKLFKSVGLIGVANAEFKRDHRDGQLKLIECNARFTAANCLLVKSGIDLASFVYNRLTSQPCDPPRSYKAGMRLWYPLDDFKSFLQMKREKEITSLEYLKSISHLQTFPYFAWDDPWPSVVRIFLRFVRIINKIRNTLKRKLSLKI